MILTDEKLSEVEKRAQAGGFTLMWPSEVIALVEEIRSLRKRLDESEWNEELALIALEAEIGERPIKT